MLKMQPCSRSSELNCISDIASILAADLLALSLFDIKDLACLKVCLEDQYCHTKRRSRKSEPVSVTSGVGVLSTWRSLVHEGWRLMLQNKVTWLSTDPDAVISHAVGVLGLDWHDGSVSKSDHSVVCKGYGQMVYPAVFDSLQPSKRATSI
jgi:hypothetical protein